MALEPGYGGNPPILVTLRDIDNKRGANGQKVRELVAWRVIDRLQWLLDHDRIQQHQYDAGRKLQNDWEISQVGTYAITADNAVPIGNASHSSALADAKLDAMVRYGNAVILLPPKAKRLIQFIVLESDKSLEKAAALMKLHYRAALPVLQDGLDILARHYGYLADNEPAIR